MDKFSRRTFFLFLSVLALSCVESVHAGATTPTTASKARAAKSASHGTAAKPPAPLSAAPTQADLARKYSPIQYCHGTSYPATTWKQVQEFLDKYSARSQIPADGSKARPAATDARIATIPKLEYPEAMGVSGPDGAVSVMVAVTKDGIAADALVICSNHPAFSDAALVAVKAATFVAATLNGSPVESVATLPIDFHP
jgi:outer membrane biosynthesis protein TonB